MPNPKILIVGGVDSFVHGNLERKLQEAGVDVGWHVSSELARFPGIPDACEGVMIIKDFCGHHVSNPAKAEAKARGVPWAAVTRKWSDAEPILRMQGILPAAYNGQIQQGTDAAVLALAVEYVTAQREWGRYPKLDEVQAVLQRVFGPSYRLSDDLFKKVMAATAEVVPLTLDEQVERVLDSEPAPVVAPAAPAPMPEDECRIAVRTVLESHPDLATQPEQIIAAMTGLAEGQANSVLVEQEAQVIRQEWAKHDAVRRDASITAWVRELLRAVQRGERTLPTQSVFYKEGKPLFGINPPWRIMQDTRAEVFGEWARVLIDAEEANLYLRHKRPDLNLMDLLQAGQIPSIAQGSRRYTSHLALDTYLATLPPVQAAVMAAPSAEEQTDMSMNENQFRELKTQMAKFEANQMALQDKLTEVLTLLKLQEEPASPTDQQAAVQATLDMLLTLVRGLAVNLSLAKAPSADGLLQLVQAGQIRLVVEPLPPKGA
ncbi:MAG: hypothetical protein A2Y38_02730 [Spirochaetes bacterium GWB1_59_5]|nr:MAG: hypothetical protein A2Y38_02730 [Spirochaetes bacterium GWB1_59_5]